MQPWLLFRVLASAAVACLCRLDGFRLFVFVLGFHKFGQAKISTGKTKILQAED